MTRAIWICTALAAYLAGVAFIWNYNDATAAPTSSATAQVDTGAITMQAKGLTKLAADMF